MRILFSTSRLFTLSLMIAVVTNSSSMILSPYVSSVSVSAMVYFSCDLFQYLFLIIDGRRSKKEWNGREITAHPYEFIGTIKPHQ